MRLNPGSRLGAYEVQSPIGSGGMGEVYRATDTKLGRDVALKVLPAEMAQDTERLGRFRREAKVLAQLDHPNIVTIHSVEESDRVHSQFAIAAQNPVQPASPAAPATATAKQESRGTEMEKVAGIGGLFFRAHDPAALGRWYLQHLGIELTPTGKDSPVWKQEAGPTVFSPFPESTKYFGDPQKMWMVNFRVHDLDKMVAQLRAAGIEVKDPETYPDLGRFARLHDPEGNPIELWQPA